MRRRLEHEQQDPQREDNAVQNQARRQDVRAFQHSTQIETRRESAEYDDGKHERHATKEQSIFHRVFSGGRNSHCHRDYMRAGSQSLGFGDGPVME